jgi:FMN phosphatase YigB (HAD superfamily)
MKNIAFDLGNVIVRVDFSPFINEWRTQGLQTEESCDAFFSDLQGQQDLGLTTVARALKERFRLNKDKIASLTDAWDEAITVSEIMAEFLQQLKDEGHYIAILSNIGTEHAALMRRKFPKIFDGCILHLSCEVGARKPTKLFFQSFMLEHPEFKDAPFIDDLPENIKRGWDCDLNGFKFNLSEFEQMDVKKQANMMRLLQEHIDFS